VPGGGDSLQQLAPCCRGLERRAALIAIVRYFFDPAVSAHPRKIARKRRGIERQQPAEFNAAHGPGLGHGHQQAELARLQAEWPQFLIVDFLRGISVSGTSMAGSRSFLRSTAWHLPTIWWLA
jgi:hypothetical protein